MKKILLALLTLNFSPFSFAEEGDRYLYKVRTFVHDGKAYRGSEYGMKAYLEEIKTKNQTVYNELTPKVDAMIKQDKIASWTYWGLAASGIGTGFYCAIKSTGFCSGDFYGPVLVGIVSGIILKKVIQPSAKDFDEIVQRHNELLPESPVQVSPIIGFMNNTGTLGVAVNY